MILRDYLDSIPPDTKVSIGAGGGYFYIGRADGWNEVPFNSTITSQNINYLTNSLKAVRSHKYTRFTPSLKEIKTLDTAYDRIDDYKPINEREIRDIYERYFGGIAIIVEGWETGKAEDPPDDEPYRIKDADGAQALVTALVRGASVDLAKGYKTGGRLGGEALRASRFFDSDLFRSLTDLDGKKLKRMIRNDPDAVLRRAKDNGEDAEED